MNTSHQFKYDNSKTKKAAEAIASAAFTKNGGALLSRGYAVPSARPGLTSLFGMGRGRTPVL